MISRIKIDGIFTMTELILGLNVFGHDSSASLINSSSGEILYCLTEERFSNKKHDGKLPIACIKQLVTLIEENQLGHIAHIATNLDYTLIINKYLFFHLKSMLDENTATLIKNEIFETLPLITAYEMGKYPCTWFEKILTENKVEASLINEILLIIGRSVNYVLKIKSFNHYIQQMFPKAKLHTVPHHDCHMASAFFTSDFDDAAILTIDGQGEAESIVLGYTKQNHYEKLSSSIWPHSLGSLFVDITAFLGFIGGSNIPGFGEEYKVMGMAAYGKPTYLPLFRKLGDVNSEGQFQYNNSTWVKSVLLPGSVDHFSLEITEKFTEELGGKRNPSEPIEQRHYDIAASLQAFIEEIGVKLATVLKQKYPSTDNLCIAGGVALNGLMNMRILQQAGFKNVFVFPASGDDGTSLGAALFVHGIILKRSIQTKFSNPFLGLKYDNLDIETTVKKYKLKYEKPKNLSKSIAEQIANNKIVARYLGRPEFGPRALGHRSILANPCSEQMKDILNVRIKHREPFRPFAPACLLKDAPSYFDIDCETPYMLLICQVKADKKHIIPAIVHNDGTARLQTVSLDSSPDLFNIITEFKALTGTPVVINTSYNVNGEAIVETPQDAIEAFLFMDIDYLAIGDILIAKEKNTTNKFNKLPIRDFLDIRKKRYKEKFNTHENFFELTETPGSNDIHTLNSLIDMYKTAAEQRLDLINKLTHECKLRDEVIAGLK